MQKIKILLSGRLDLGPIGRHAISFLLSLVENKTNEIYISEEYLLDKGKTLRGMFPDLLGKITLVSKLSDKQNYDFLIFTDILPTYEANFDCYTALKVNAKIKICYPVFDGSMPPLEWIDTINDNFDLCLTPSRYVAHNLIRYGVKIDCCHLHCGILLEDFLPLQPRQKDGKTGKFRFGSVGALDFRKNIAKLIEAFAETFSEEEDVELFIHSSYGNDFRAKEDLAKVLEKYKDRTNIIVQQKTLPHREMIKLWESFDVYISPQTTTGYFTTPAEALAAGIPVVVSDIAVHKEMLEYAKEEGNIFFVEHKDLRPAFHLVFQFRQLGVKFDADVKSYQKVLRQVFNERNKLYTQKLIEQRKEGASKLKARSLSGLYQQVTSPIKLLAGGFTAVTKEGLYLTSNTLVKKYSELGFKYEALSGHDTPIDTSSHKEEFREDFQAMERVALESQGIYLARFKNTLKCKKVANFYYILNKLNQKAINHKSAIAIKVAYRFLKINWAVKRDMGKYSGK